MPTKPPPRRPDRPPSIDEINAVAGAMPHNLGALVLCAAWSGLRLSETCNLEVRNVTDCGDYATLDFKQKGSRQRRAVLLSPGWEVVRQLPSMRSSFPQTPLFMRPENAAGSEKWTRKLVWSMLNEVRPGLGLEHVIFHDFRKFYASYLLNKGVVYEDVAVALGHLDRNGQPRTELIRLVYGFVNHDLALARAVEVANVVSTGEVAAAAHGRVGQGERDQVASGVAQASDQGGVVESARGVGGADTDARDDEGLGGVVGGAEGRAYEGQQDPASDFRSALEDARRRVAPAAGRVDRRVAS